MGTKPDLKGKTFYDLYVIKETDPKIRPDGRKNRMWECKCKCGNTVVLSTSCLTTGNTKSCGCRKHDSVLLSRQKDLINKTFSDLFVESRAPYKTNKNGIRKSMWNCICICGTKCVVSQDSLISGRTKSCGCRNIKKLHERLEDLSGKRFGMLLVENFAFMKDTPGGQHIAYWNCVCNCGNKKTVRGTSLKNGYATSCGCYKKAYLSEFKTINLENEVFGYLTVIKRVTSESKRKRRCASWLCKCKCGNEKIIPSDLLLYGHTTSCGCKGRSAGETAVCMVLDKIHIPYKQWYSFDDLRGKRNMPLPFDFAILDRNNSLLGLIEYQGEQHYNEKKGKWGETQRLRTDPVKREYCKQNNIPLCEIKYNESILPVLKTFLQQIYANVNLVPSL